MAKYRKISPFIRDEEKVRGMTDKGKLALLFLHMTPPGAIRANAPGGAYGVSREWCKASCPLRGREERREFGSAGRERA